MADSLDDFFAKKDKKRKNKNQTSVLSAETLVRELEEGAKQSEYSSRRDGKTSAAMELLGLDTNDNDWKDFEEVEKRDYTGLKVKEMSIQDQEEEHRRLVEKTEQVPEIKPWKSKEDTVAAIIAAREGADVLASDLLQEGDEEVDNDDEGSKEKQPAAEETSDDSKVDSSKPAVSTSVADGQDQDQAEKSDSSKDGEKPSETTPGDSTAPTKDGDSSKPAKYVPPHERLGEGVQQLAPVKLSKLVGGGGGGLSRFRGGRQNQLNIEDENAFPTLG